MKQLNKLLLLVLLFLASPKVFSQDYDVGVFYMPFWWYPGTDPMEGNWSKINNYDAYLVGKGLSHKARMPLNNYWPSPVWYDEKMASVTEKQFELMKSNEIDFVVIDSFWAYFTQFGFYGTYWNHVLENLIEPGFNFHGMNFAIMWSNDFKQIVVDGGCQRYLRSTNEGLEGMMSYWSQFINHPQYKKIDGKPAFYIYYPNMPGDSTSNNIEGIGTYCKDDPFFAPLGSDINDPDKRTKFLLERIEQLVGQDLYFVAVMSPNEIPRGEPVNITRGKFTSGLVNHTQNAGFDAVTSYGYKYFDQADANSDTPFELCNGVSSYSNWNYDYTTMQGVYNDFYSFMLSNSNLKYQVPVSAGWNRGPLNMDEVNVWDYADSCNDYSRDPLDQAIATPALFEQSLITAKNIANANSTKTKNIIMLSAWNEYGEGTVIEPNTQWGGQFLQKVKDVFTPPPPVINGPDQFCNNPAYYPAGYFIEGAPVNSTTTWSVTGSIAISGADTGSLVYVVPSGSDGWGTLTASTLYSGTTVVTSKDIMVGTPPWQEMIMGLDDVYIGNSYPVQIGAPYPGATGYSWSTSYDAYVAYENGLTAEIGANSPGYHTITVTAYTPCGNVDLVWEFYAQDNYYFMAYPNPAGDELIVSFDTKAGHNEKSESAGLDKNLKPKAFSIVLYNEKGEALRTMSTGAGQKSLKMDTREISNGTYFLHISDGKKVIKKQIIIQH